MRFLQLTDLHVGQGSDAQLDALTSLVQDVRREVTGPVDAVFITGDIAQAGTEKEYTRFNELLLSPLRALESLSGATVIAVPGNHDLQSRMGLPISWENLDPHRQEVFFDDSDSGRAMRTQRAQLFDAYTKWLQSSNVRGLDPKQEVCSVVRLENANVLCLNTCLFSDWKQSDEHRTPAPVQSLRLAARNLAGAQKTLVLGHHPIGWFTKDTQQSFRALLQDLEAVYFHGHLHAVGCEWSQSGLLSIGFGAAYQAPLAHAKLGYKNSYCFGSIERELHVATREWDSLNGRWTWASNMPADFSQQSALFARGFSLRLPRRTEAVELRVKSASTVTGVIVTNPLTRQQWQSVLNSAGLTERHAEWKEIVHEQFSAISDFLVEQGGEKRRVRCIGGSGHVLSLAQLEAENTRFDTEDYHGLLIVSLGSIAEDARRLATRLERKKQIKLIDNRELAELLGKHLVLASHESAPSETVLVFDGGEWLQIVTDKIKGAWFFVIGADGVMLPQSEPRVAAARKARPLLRDSAYGTQASMGSGPALARFDREKYLLRCSEAFDTLQYSGLASVGTVLPTSRLTEVYVAPSADVSSDDHSQAASRAISELVDSLQLDEAARVQFEAQIRATRHAGRPRETKSARAIYQQRTNVAVLGDPGSGKTSFVKSEILAYCKPPSQSDNWYSSHTPVFVPLSEAAALFGSGADLSEVAAAIAARQGLPLEAQHLRDLIAVGGVAFFFDGLDEVSIVAMRASLLEAIASLIEETGPTGNRFVLTSRPAAVQVVNIPEHFTTIHLRGLTDEEIERLAGHLIDLEFSLSDDQIALRTPANEALALARQIVNDCRRNPGIRRLASNPLLLTLLVMIYVNSGPLAAKRHRVYAQAVATLVSVRNRSKGVQVFSESDLRRRLGHVATTVFDSGRTELPSRVEFEKILADALSKEGVRGDVLITASNFVQSVAENTGILTLHQRALPNGGGAVSFMHHSFFEYYVAQGMLLRGGLDALGSHVLEARWREVISLVVGILGDVADPTPVVSNVLASSSQAEEVSGERLLFALDCALECDVAPEATQRAIAEAVTESVRTGPARVDAEFRDALGGRLARLIESSNSPVQTGMLAAGVSESSAPVAAAFGELIGFVGLHTDLPKDVVTAFEVLAARREPIVLVSVVSAIASAPALRSDGALAALKDAFRGPSQARMAASRACERAPALAVSVQEQLVACLDDSNTAISSSAARALLEGGVEPLAPNNRQLVDKCLRVWGLTRQIEKDRILHVNVEKAHVERLLVSDTLSDRILGIRLLPWLQRDDAFVLNTILAVLRAKADGSLHRAALVSLRQAERARSALTLADADILLRALSHKERDIRIGSARALMHVGGDYVADQLLVYASRARQDEYREALTSLVSGRTKNPKVRAFVLAEMKTRVRSPGAGAFGDQKRQREIRALLRAAEQFEGDASPELERLLVQLVDSYKTPKSIRSQAVRTYAGVSIPSMRVITRLQKWSANADLDETVAGESMLVFLRRCRTKVEYVTSVKAALPTVVEALSTMWGTMRSRGAAAEAALRALRKAIREAQTMHAAYGHLSQQP